MAKALTTHCACTKKHPIADPTAGGKLCGAQTRGSEAKYPTCHRPSGWGTSCAGTVRAKCKLHGGASRITHGRYAVMRSGRVRDLAEQIEKDPDPLNILPEIHHARALYVDFIDRYEENTEAMLAWHESYEALRVPLPEEKVMAFEGVVNEWEIKLRESGTEATERQLAEISAARAFLNILRGKGLKGQVTKPRTILDIADAYRILDTITKMVERVEKIRAANAISRPDLNRLMDHMGRVVMANVDDPVKLKNIRKGWLSLAV